MSLRHHGPQDMPAVIQLARYLISHNQHWVSATVGKPGAGKSDFNMCLAIAIQAPAPFVPRKQIAMRPMDRKAVSMNLAKGRVVMDDESTGKGGHRRRSMSTENVDNAQDFDAMRGRNQATLLTGPDFQDLDTVQQKHCKMVFDVRHDHTATAYEVVQSGKPNNRYWNLAEAFVIDEMPHAAVLYPKEWAAYSEMKNDFLRGQDVAKKQRDAIWQDKANKTILDVLRL